MASGMAFLPSKHTATESCTLLQPAMRPFVPAIEGLRCVLTVWVMSFHYYAFFPRTPESSTSGLLEWAANLVTTPGAFFVVDFFFIISGFVAQFSSGPPLATPSEWARYVALKASRLAPQYLASLLFGTIITVLVANHQHIPVSANLRPVATVLSWFALHDWWVGDKNFLYQGNGGLWFVSALLGCFAIFALTGHRMVHSLMRTPYGAAALALFFSLGRALLRAWPSYWCMYWPPSCAVGFLAGVATARLLQQLLPSMQHHTGEGGGWAGDGFSLPSLPRSCNTWWWAVADVPCFLVLALSFSPFFSFMWAPGMPFAHGFPPPNFLQPVCCVVLFLAGCPTQGIVLRCLSHRAFVALSPLAYGAYCWHLPMKSFLCDLLELPPERTFTLVVFFTLSWLASALVLHGIEGPWNSTVGRWLRASGRGAQEHATTSGLSASKEAAAPSAASSC